MFYLAGKNDKCGVVSYTPKHRYAPDSHAADISLINIYLRYELHHRSASSKLCNIYPMRYNLSIMCQAQCEGQLIMKKKLNSLKYFAPLVQLALCPVTILFLWAVLTGPEVIPEVNEELVREDRVMNTGYE